MTSVSALSCAGAVPADPLVLPPGRALHPARAVPSPLPVCLPLPVLDPLGAGGGPRAPRPRLQHLHISPGAVPTSEIR